MIRFQATSRNGDYESERIVEVDNLQELTEEERVILFGMASGVMVGEIAEETIELESTIGSLKVKVDADFSSFEEKLEKIREILSSPLGDFVTVVVESETQENSQISGQ
ncbi:hypothetical protein ACDZ28_10695 [Paenibacillus sp. RS8]|uniref:hypothetical protein n=1 Tax=Paenibacillus sp. RS8 TaxID=3242681 RepID=UPI0035C1CBD1